MPEVIDPDVIEREPAPVAEPAQTEAETPVAEAAPEPETPEGAPAEQAAAEPDRDRKSPVNQLKGRVGHLTKVVHQKDEELAEARRQNETYKALLEGRTPEAEAATAPAPARNGATPPDFDAAVAAKAAELAAANAFNTECNKVWEAGNAEFKDGFAESIDNLNTTGLARRDVIEAAIATDAAPQVLHYLGQDLDEAARIAALPPAAMGVALAKLATKLSAAPPPQQHSNAPPPIKPLGGSASPSLDISDPNLSDDEYYARRVKMGAPYVRLPKQSG